MKRTEDEFQSWLAYMDDALDEFFAMLPMHVRNKLDYSIDSLDVLEAWLLERYPNPDAVIQTSETLLLDGAARYIGETFRKNLGGHWWFDLDGWTHDGLPQLGGLGAGQQASVCPLALLREAIDTRTGHVLGTVLDSHGHAARAGSPTKS